MGITALDAGVVAALLLIGIGGYRQGLLRGITRFSALLIAALLALLLGFGTSLRGAIETIILRSAALFAGVLLVAAGVALLVNRLIPRVLHESLINRVLGIFPALLQGLIVISLVLGLAHRVAITDEMAHYLAGGRVTGPLIQPFDWLERSLAGVP
jgi:uncharacterized membrane protein required for colicin V production